MVIKVCIAIIKMMECVAVGYKGTTVDNSAPRFFKRYHHSIFRVCFIREIIRVCNDCSESGKFTRIFSGSVFDLPGINRDKGTTVNLHVYIIGDHSSSVIYFAQPTAFCVGVYFTGQIIGAAVEDNLGRIRVRIVHVISLTTITDCVNIECSSIVIIKRVSIEVYTTAAYRIGKGNLVTGINLNINKISHVSGRAINLAAQSMAVEVKNNIIKAYIYSVFFHVILFNRRSCSRQFKVLHQLDGHIAIVGHAGAVQLFEHLIHIVPVVDLSNPGAALPISSAT